MLIINRKNAPSQVVSHDLNRTKSLSKILEKIFQRRQIIVYSYILQMFSTYPKKYKNSDWYLPFLKRREL